MSMDSPSRTELQHPEDRVNEIDTRAGMIDDRRITTYACEVCKTIVAGHLAHMIPTRRLVLCAESRLYLPWPPSPEQVDIWTRDPRGRR